MAGKSLQDLGLKPEAVGGADFGDMPEQIGSWTPPPQPGKYRLKLPSNLGQVWDTTEVDGKTRVVAKFDDDFPMTIVQSPGDEHNGEAFKSSVSNVGRNRARKGQPEVLVSDMDYLLKALGETSKPKDNAGYITALQKYAGKDFSVDLTWSWFCNPKRNKRIDNGEGGQVEIEEPGCGKRYYQKVVAKGDGKFPLYITCECGAIIRAFVQMGNFQA